MGLLHILLNNKYEYLTTSQNMLDKIVNNLYEKNNEHINVNIVM